MHLEDISLSPDQLLQLKQACLNGLLIVHRGYGDNTMIRVGCTIVTDDDQFISGGNIENASYGACICAERSTIAKASNEGKRKYKVIAISSDSADPISPCGICRQFIREFNANVPVVMYNKTGAKVTVMTLSELLPMSFGPENLGIPPP